MFFLNFSDNPSITHLTLFVNHYVCIANNILYLSNRETPAAAEGTKDTFWAHRIQDLCDELLAEAHSERYLYEAWAAGGLDTLEQTLCNGSGIFSACKAGSFGPWPHDDDYSDDYEDEEDEDFSFHDEF